MRNYYNPYYNYNRDPQSSQSMQDFNQQGSYNYGSNYNQPQGMQGYNQGTYGSVAPNSYGNSYGNYGSGYSGSYNYGSNYNQPQGMQGYNQGTYGSVAPNSYGQASGNFRSYPKSPGNSDNSEYTHRQSVYGYNESPQQGNNKFKFYNRY